MSVENPMANNLPTEKEVIGTCHGCDQDIFKGEEVFEYEDILVHADSSCCFGYMYHHSVFRIAGA